jgi:hypothetical protein
VIIGFFSGFYIVPLYTLLQHRAPKTSKGDLIATSNFINVTGAILASCLFIFSVSAAKWVGLAESIPQKDVAHGELWDKRPRNSEHPIYIEVRESKDEPAEFKVGRRPDGLINQNMGFWQFMVQRWTIRKELPSITMLGDLRDGDKVHVSKYSLRGIDHYEVRSEDTPLTDAFDQQLVPMYLFIGASGMTMIILILLCRQLPDFFVRALLWIRSHGRYRLRVVGLNNLPSNGPVILATNCDRFQECMQAVAATDRYTRFILLEKEVDEQEGRPLLRYLANRTGLIVLRPAITTPTMWEKALAKARKSLDNGELLGLTVVSNDLPNEAENFFLDLTRRQSVTILPLFCGRIHSGRFGSQDGILRHRRIPVVIGHPMPPESTYEQVRKAIEDLRELVTQAESTGQSLTTLTIPEVSAALPTAPGTSHPVRP